MWNHNLTLLAIMLLAGGFGGIVNHLLDKRSNRDAHSLTRSLFSGIAASLLVPLFLNMISSTLLAQSANDDEKLFVFSGFCLIAAISSSAFIRRLSDKVLQDVEELRKHVRETATNLAFLLEAQTEPAEWGRTPPAAEKALPLDENSSAVLKALTEGKYALRSTHGISHDAGLDVDQTGKNLDDLASRGLVRRWESDEGTRWVATATGRLLFLERTTR